MRRILPAAAFIVPLAVGAAISVAPTGKVVDLDNYNAEATPATSYISAAQCAGAPLDLQWSTVDVAGGLVGSGEYRIFASNTEPPAADGDGRFANFCDEDDNDGGTGPDIFAGRLEVTPWRSDIQGLEASGADAAALANVTCDDAGESEIVWICAHLYEGSTRKGHASGQFVVQVRAPSPPSGVVAGPASETSISVQWTPPASTLAEVDHYVAVATDPDGNEFRSGTTDGTDATIGGLTDGVTYRVVVHAYSLAGNESAASASDDASPAPVDDFWDAYVRAGGVDDGGCSTGSAGPLALLAAAAHLRLRRRA
jgi:hypothetical protein